MADASTDVSPGVFGAMPTRYAISFFSAAIITFGLYWLMQTLIASGKGAFDEGAKGRVVDFVRLKKDQDLDVKKRKPKKPPPPPMPPELQPKPQNSLSPVENAFDMGAMAPDQVELAGFGLSPSDGEYLPIVKVAPIYPRRAASRGIEGWVLLEFTVTKAGTVRDPVVIESAPSSIFDKSARNAALKFKYKPRVVNGVPIEVPGVRNRIVFELED